MRRALFVLAVMCGATQGAGPVLLNDRFELPPGFSIYRAAGPEISGGSYALTFDGDGRLLVGDGTAIRRLTDQDHGPQNGATKEQRKAAADKWRAAMKGK